MQSLRRTQILRSDTVTIRYHHSHAGKRPAPILPPISNNSGTGYQANNSDVMAILLDQTKYPENGRDYAPNPGHAKNPQQISFLNLKAAPDNTSSGLGSDLVYRDPYGATLISLRWT